MTSPRRVVVFRTTFSLSSGGFSSQTRRVLSLTSDPTLKRLLISACFISGAEGHRIGRALASVADWTSEIVIVLNEEVRDTTEEISRSYGAKVFREPWKGFLAQKNSA